MDEAAVRSRACKALLVRVWCPAKPVLLFVLCVVPRFDRKQHQISKHLDCDLRSGDEVALGYTQGHTTRSARPKLDLAQMPAPEKVSSPKGNVPISPINMKSTPKAMRSTPKAESPRRLAAGGDLFRKGMNSQNGDGNATCADAGTNNVQSRDERPLKPMVRSLTCTTFQGLGLSTHLCGLLLLSRS